MAVSVVELTDSPAAAIWTKRGPDDGALTVSATDVLCVAEAPVPVTVTV